MSKDVRITKVVQFDEDSLQAFRELAEFGKEIARIARHIEIIVDEVRSQVRLETLETTVENADVEMLYFND